MKIVISNYDDLKNPYYGGGGAIVIHEIAKRMTQNNQIIVITGKYPNSKDEIIDRVRYVRVGTSIHPKIDQLFFQLFVVLKSYSVKFDIWIESFTPPFSTSFLPLFSKKEIVGFAQMITGKEKSKEYFVPFHLIESIGLQCYKNIITLTQTTADEIKKTHPNINTFVIPNGVDESIFLNKKSNDKETEYFLYIGRIDVHQKGLDLLIETFSKISDKVSADLVIIGAGPQSEESELKKLIYLYKLQNRVKLLGKKYSKEKIRFINNASFIVMPSRYEGMSLTAIESIVLNKPLLVFDIKDFEWATEKSVIKVHAFDTDLYAKQLVLLSNNKKYRDQCLSTPLEREKYHWNRITTQYEKLLNQIISK